MKFSCTQAGARRLHAEIKELRFGVGKKRARLFHRRRAGTLRFSFFEPDWRGLAIAYGLRQPQRRLPHEQNRDRDSRETTCSSSLLMLAPFAVEPRLLPARLSARSIPASSTSQCVTSRTEYTAVSCAQTPRLYSMSHHSTAVFPVFEQSKITIFVLHLRRIDHKTRNLRHTLRQPLRVFMIDMQSRRRLLQRNQPCRRDHARLPHPAAEHLPIDARLLDKFLRTRQSSTPPARPVPSTSKTSPSPRFRVIVATLLTKRRRRIKNPRSIQMHLQPNLVRMLANFIHLRRRIHASRPPCCAYSPGKPARSASRSRSSAGSPPRSASKSGCPSSARAIRGMHPAIADIDASSYKFTWLRSSQITSSP